MTTLRRSEAERLCNGCLQREAKVNEGGAAKGMWKVKDSDEQWMAFPNRYSGGEIVGHGGHCRKVVQ